MALFKGEKPRVICEEGLADLGKARLSDSLSSVNFNTDEDYFFVTVDRVMFSDPVTTVKTFLEAHGYVPNLENILSCLDSFVFGIHARAADKPADDARLNIREYLPCIRLELPNKHRVGPVLQSFYDELSRYDPDLIEAARRQAGTGGGEKSEKLRKENEELKRKLKEQEERLTLISEQLAREQKSLSRASRALDSQRILPDNAWIGRVERIDLRRRTVCIKLTRETFDLPTQMLDRVPSPGARCLVTTEEGADSPIGVVFFDSSELSDLEYRVADVLFVEDDTFKARDSRRNEFQIKALHDTEAEVIRGLRRGSQVVLKMSEDHVIHFSALDRIRGNEFRDRVQENILLFDTGRNALVGTTGANAGTLAPGGGEP